MEQAGSAEARKLGAVAREGSRNLHPLFSNLSPLVPYLFCGCDFQNGYERRQMRGNGLPSSRLSKCPAEGGKCSGSQAEGQRKTNGSVILLPLTLSLLSKARDPLLKDPSCLVTSLCHWKCGKILFNVLIMLNSQLLQLFYLEKALI